MLRPLVRPLVRALTRSPMESRGLRPTLSLDFTNGGVTDSRVTYSGGNNGTITNSAGLIVAATTPRFDYNPVTLAPLGLLVEEARTNLLVRSSEFQTTWVGGNHSISADAITSPDGTANADAMVENTAASQFHYIGQTVTKAASAIQYTFSAYVKTKGRVVEFGLNSDGGSNGAVMFFNPATGTITTAAVAYGTFTGASGSAAAVGNGWYHLVLTATTGTATSVVAQFNLNNGSTNVYTGDGVKGVYLWGAQLEAGSFPTSYIPTVAASVTRSADSAVMTGTNFSDPYNQTEGTFVVDADTANLGGNSGIVGVGDSSLAFGAAEAFYAAYASANSGRQSVYVLDGGVFQAAIDTGAAQTINVAAKLAFAYALNNTAAASKGSAAVVDTSCTMPTPTGLSLGSLNGAWSGGANYLNGHVKTLRYYPQRLPNATLQGMTA